MGDFEQIDLDVTRLEPGSVVLVRPKKPLAQDQRERIRDALNKQLPNGITAVLLASRLEVMSLDEVVEEVGGQIEPDTQPPQPAD